VILGDRTTIVESVSFVNMDRAESSHFLECPPLKMDSSVGRNCQAGRARRSHLAHRTVAPPFFHSSLVEVSEDLLACDRGRPDGEQEKRVRRDFDGFAVASDGSVVTAS
jgi:hypothetical protein